MNIKESNKHFAKLSAFYSSLTADGKVNQIELDLLKAYVLNFYESLSATTSNNDIQATPAQVASTPAPTPKVESPVTASASPQAEIHKEVKAAVATPVVAGVATTVAKTNLSKDIKDLFAIAKGNEISDKLSTTPIKDIGKSMSINEKIFTIQELFNGNQTSFDEAIAKLNGLSSYNEAQDFLAEKVVSENNWLDPSKSKKVKTFLKLVHRKYV